MWPILGSYYDITCAEEPRKNSFTFGQKINNSQNKQTRRLNMSHKISMHIINNNLGIANNFFLKCKIIMF